MGIEEQVERCRCFADDDFLSRGIVGNPVNDFIKIPRGMWREKRPGGDKVKKVDVFEFFGQPETNYPELDHDGEDEPGQVEDEKAGDDHDRSREGDKAYRNFINKRNINTIL